MENFYDVAIIGAGAMGSAATYHLSKSGKKILVIDRFTPPHQLGSSHGESRIIREAYFENPVYVPLVQQAYELWYELEKILGEKLLLKTGGLMMGTHDCKVVQGALRSALQYHLPYEYLDHLEIKKRFPGFKLNENTVGIFEENAGILFPELCIKTHLELAKNTNVTFHFNEIVEGIVSNNKEVKIITGKEKYVAEKVIVSAGAWLNELLPDLQLPLTVARQVLFWFKCSGSCENFETKNFPIYIWQIESDKIFYGFPDLGSGIKIAIHHRGKKTNPNVVNRSISEEEIDEMIGLVKNYFNIQASFSHSSVCMYTNTPDEDFIIDHHPFYKNIIIASPCSGHGFKFSSAIGKLLAGMVLEKKLDFDISVFNVKRFKNK